MDPVGALHAAAESGLMPEGSAILLAVSGGADSMALLAAAADVAPARGWKISIGHVHHGWRGREADRDLTFVAAHAGRLGLPMLRRRRDARGSARRLKLSPEAAARAVRYEALAEMAEASGSALVATAHQRDDRVESFLLAVERRAGLAALAGPRVRREDGVVRPFLAVSRAEILQFLSKRGLGFRRDATNGDLRLSRNRVRRRLTALRAVRGEEAIAALDSAVDRFAGERDRREHEFLTAVLPRLSIAPGSVVADADFLERCRPALLRIALERTAAPFSLAGHPPLTGTEREQILQLVAAGADFRFEAGRRIRFERRGPILTVALARRESGSATGRRLGRMRRRPIA
jgi:tRNA(Ile)-lysidine synthase